LGAGAASAAPGLRRESYGFHNLHALLAGGCRLLMAAVSIQE